ncbi:hypothetical protein CAMGR0001_0285 [Campylobacter gracilis RM3268]|uniref:Uncharacterized protein n=1 Tax=Campylobacter gracilis RM3268 TaxID=553220 RepID=C8PKR2_9BACT|nr:hypothetical protein CAMGR0001_0285 [Campylobacter gracilis RM3268]
MIVPSKSNKTRFIASPSKILAAQILKFAYKKGVKFKS